MGVQGLWDWAGKAARACRDIQKTFCKLEDVGLDLPISYHLDDVSGSHTHAYFTAATRNHRLRIEEILAQAKGQPITTVSLSLPSSEAQHKVNAACRQAISDHTAALRKTCLPSTRVLRFYDNPEGPRLAKTATDLDRRTKVEADRVRAVAALATLASHPGRQSTKRQRKEQSKSKKDKKQSNAVSRAYDTLRKTAYVLFQNPLMHPVNLDSSSLHPVYTEDLEPLLAGTNYEAYLNTRYAANSDWLVSNDPVIDVLCSSEADLSIAMTAELLVKRCGASPAEIMVHSQDGDLLILRTSEFYRYMARYDKSKPKVSKGDANNDEVRPILVIDKDRLAESSKWPFKSSSEQHLVAILSGNDYVPGGLKGINFGTCVKLKHKAFSGSIGYACNQVKDQTTAGKKISDEAYADFQAFGEHALLTMRYCQHQPVPKDERDTMMTVGDMNDATESLSDEEALPNASARKAAQAVLREKRRQAKLLALYHKSSEKAVKLANGLPSGHSDIDFDKKIPRKAKEDIDQKNLTRENAGRQQLDHKIVLKLSRQPARAKHIRSFQDLPDAPKWDKEEVQRTSIDSNKRKKGKTRAAVPKLPELPKPSKLSAKLPDTFAASSSSLRGGLRRHLKTVEEQARELEDVLQDATESEKKMALPKTPEEESEQAEGLINTDMPTETVYEKLMKQHYDNKTNKASSKAKTKPASDIWQSSIHTRTIGGAWRLLIDETENNASQTTPVIFQAAANKTALEMPTFATACKSMVEIIFDTGPPSELLLLQREPREVDRLFLALTYCLADPDERFGGARHRHFKWYLEAEETEQRQYRLRLAQQMFISSTRGQALPPGSNRTYKHLVNKLNEWHASPQFRRVIASTVAKAGEPYQHILLPTLQAVAHTIINLDLPWLVPMSNMQTEWASSCIQYRTCLLTSPKQDFARIVKAAAFAAAGTLDYATLPSHLQNATLLALQQLFHLTLWHEGFSTGVRLNYTAEDMRLGILEAIVAKKAKHAEKQVSDVVENKGEDDSERDGGWLTAQFLAAAASCLDTLIQERDNSIPYSGLPDFSLLELNKPTATEKGLTIWLAYRYANVLKRRLSDKSIAPVFAPTWADFYIARSVDWLSRGLAHLSLFCQWLDRYTLPALLQGMQQAVKGGVLRSDDTLASYEETRSNLLGFLDDLPCFEHVVKRQTANMTRAVVPVKSIGTILQLAGKTKTKVGITIDQSFAERHEKYMVRIRAFLQVNDNHTSFHDASHNNRLVLAHLLFRTDNLPRYCWPVLGLSCDGVNFQIHCIALNKAWWPKTKSVKLSDGKTKSVKQPDVQAFEEWTLTSLFNLAGCDPQFAYDCHYGEEYRHSLRRDRPTMERNNTFASRRPAKPIQPLLPNQHSPKHLGSVFGHLSQYFDRQNRPFRRTSIAAEKTTSGLPLSVRYLKEDTHEHYKDLLSYVQKNGEMPHAAVDEKSIRGHAQIHGFDLSAVTPLGVDSGYAYSNALWWTVKGRPPQPPDKADGENAADNPATDVCSEHKGVTMLQSPHYLQEITKQHSRKLFFHRRRFPVDIDTLARQKAHAKVYAILQIIFRHSKDARNEDWQRRKRVAWYYESIVSQFLERSGLKSPVNLPADEMDVGRLGAAQFFHPCKSMLFCIGAGLSSGSVKTHTADFHNELLRRIVRRCRDDHLPVVFALVNEDWSSQVCHQPSCTVPRCEDWSQAIQDPKFDESHYDMIRSRLHCPTFRGKNWEMHRTHRCEKCGQTTNRDLSAACNIAVNGWHLLRFRKQAFSEHPPVDTSIDNTGAARQDAAQPLQAATI